MFDDQGATAEELAARVTPFLRAHLDAYPMAVNEFKTLAVGGTTIFNQSNTGTGVFIGGDNHGGLTINHGTSLRPALRRVRRGVPRTGRAGLRTVGRSLC
ncbi:hypothetical protein [Streptomyces sp. TRM49041]|uniref:hypothetical protein n=1 Tax=Streptomyces sp. TRM49041 TaxID=2603216 RepID=UPI0011ED2659|nr:hypothetical protein [Streptomyces sp. TRM49041]